MRHPGDLNPAFLQPHDDEDVDRGHAVPRPNLYGCEIDRGDRVPVRLQERLPRRGALPRRRRLRAVFPEDVPDGRIRDPAAKFFRECPDLSILEFDDLLLPPVDVAGKDHEKELLGSKDVVRDRG